MVCSWLTRALRGQQYFPKNCWKIHKGPTIINQQPKPISCFCNSPRGMMIILWPHQQHIVSYCLIYGDAPSISGDIFCVDFAKRFLLFGRHIQFSEVRLYQELLILQLVPRQEICVRSNFIFIESIKIEDTMLFLIMITLLLRNSTRVLCIRSNITPPPAVCAPPPHSCAILLFILIIIIITKAIASLRSA